MPVQEFQIGDRVRLRTHGGPFVLGVAHIACDGHTWYGPCIGSPVFRAHELTLAPERPPYVASERRVFDLVAMRVLFSTSDYRCETDAELAERRAFERAAYDAQGDEA